MLYCWIQYMSVIVKYFNKARGEIEYSRTIMFYISLGILLLLIWLSQMESICSGFGVDCPVLTHKLYEIFNKILT